MDDTERRLLSAANQAVRQRNYRRARDRALARLSQAYPNEYRQLLEEERTADERESKKWMDISGATSPDSIARHSGSQRLTTTSTKGRSRKRKAKNKGYLGRKARK